MTVMTGTPNTAPAEVLQNIFRLLVDSPAVRKRASEFQKKQQNAEAGEKSLMGAVTAHEQHESEIRKELARLQTETEQRRDSVGELDRRLVKISDGAAALAEKRRALDEYETTTRAELKAENAALTKRRGADFAERQDLSKRSERIDKLRKAWSIFRESDDVQSGFRSSATSPLEKARAAHAGSVPAGLYGERIDIAAPGSEPFANDDDDDMMPTLPPEQIPRVPSPPIETRPKRGRRVSRTAARRS